MTATTHPPCGRSTHALTDNTKGASRGGSVVVVVEVVEVVDVVEVVEVDVDVELVLEVDVELVVDVDVELVLDVDVELVVDVDVELVLDVDVELVVDVEVELVLDVEVDGVVVEVVELGGAVVGGTVVEVDVVAGGVTIVVDVVAGGGSTVVEVGGGGGGTIETSDVDVAGGCVVDVLDEVVLESGDNGGTATRVGSGDKVSGPPSEPSSPSPSFATTAGAVGPLENGSPSPSPVAATYTSAPTTAAAATMVSTAGSG